MQLYIKEGQYPTLTSSVRLQWDWNVFYGASPDADVGLIITFIVRQEPPVPANMIIHSKPALDEQCSAQVFKRAGCHLKRAHLAR